MRLGRRKVQENVLATASVTASALVPPENVAARRADQKEVVSNHLRGPACGTSLTGNYTGENCKWID